MVGPYYANRVCEVTIFGCLYSV